jgi:hypothetical protein
MHDSVRMVIMLSAGKDGRRSIPTKLYESLAGRRTHRSGKIDDGLWRSSAAATSCLKLGKQRDDWRKDGINRQAESDLGAKSTSDC